MGQLRHLPFAKLLVVSYQPEWNGIEPNHSSVLGEPVLNFVFEA